MKNPGGLFTIGFIIFFVGLAFWTQMPQMPDDGKVPLQEFSTGRAYEHVREMSREPHYIGSDGHKVVAEYILRSLRDLGLNPVEQEGFSLTEWGNLVRSRNIMARIEGKGNGKALMLLSHYDSAPHTKSKGASDDAVGVAAILEAVRAVRHARQTFENDIIILFTDAEELGLNGAATFVSQHEWVGDVGLILNLEARGTAGPSFMLLETTSGNAELVKGFSQAGPSFPAASSLMYSIYKMLPNDTDLTVFRENAKIQGFNFAFIDDHFNYHTPQDDATHLDLRSLAHQGSYLMPLIGYFGNADLTKLETADERVYFNIPFFFVNFPFSWIIPMLVACVVLLLGIVVIGIGKRVLLPGDIGRGFLMFFASMITAGLIVFFGWKAILAIYPSYAEIQHGFTYNGHAYMAAFFAVSLAICFFWYGRPMPENKVYGYAVAPLTVWTIICVGLAFYLPGAAFFMIPILAGIFMLGIFVATQRHSQIATLLLAIPALFIFVPLIWTLPIGLGLKVMFGSAVLLVLSFGALLPALASIRYKRGWATVFVLMGIGWFIQAHINSDYVRGKGLPNSLVYFWDTDTDKTWWTTYDKTTDAWTQNYLGTDPAPASALQSVELFSKYGMNFTYQAPAPKKDLAKPTVEFLRDTVIASQRYVKIRISPSRKVNRYDIFASNKMVLHNLKANGVKHINQEKSAYKRMGKKVLSYYVVDQQPLELEFSYANRVAFDMELLESSFDLMTNPLFSVPERPDNMIPKPFILNDAVALRMKIKPSTPTLDSIGPPTQVQPVKPVIDTLYMTE
jgi:hypothetical protein